MKRTRLFAVLVGVAVIASFASDASARYRMYNPATGAFMQRDPLGTPLGPSLARNVSDSRFTQRDPAVGDTMRVGTTGPLVGGGFIPRDLGPVEVVVARRSGSAVQMPSGRRVQQDVQKQYKDGMSLYQYVRSNPSLFVDSIGLSVSYSGCECCPGIEEAVQRVNRALGIGECREWFEEHGHDYSTGTPSRSIACHGDWKIPCLLGFPAWTMPGMRIGVCNSKCAKLGPVALSSIIIHELAHHYCTWFWGREDCAISAQDACADALLGG
jgi:hypothetical protein